MVARRQAHAWAKNPQNPIAENPQDYCLYRVGTFDEQTGEITSTSDHPYAVFRFEEIEHLVDVDT